MKELFFMWRNTRMVVLTAICAAVYVAVLIPFKIFPIIPGFTEFRPAAVVPILCSVLFGPAAAWGAGLGNVMGDFIGAMFGPGSLFGFFGNFLLGYVPYKFFSLLRHDPESRGSAAVARFLLVIFITCAACSTVIGWGLDLIGLVPFLALANITFANNFVLNAILSPILIALIYPRVKRMGLLYGMILEQAPFAQGKLALIGGVLMVVGAVGGLGVGNLQGVVHLTSSLPVSVAVAPFIACIALAVVLF